MNIPLPAPMYVASATRKVLCLLLAIPLFLISCISKKDTAATTRPPAFQQGPLDSVYTALRPAIQTFTIDNKKTDKIKAANGTEILIPANCFVTADGDPVEKVQLEVVEAFSLPAFVASGLATMSGDKLLISNGMIYLNARAGDENLSLVEGMSLTVSMPTMGDNSGFQMFAGDGATWTVDTAMTETDYIFPLPLDLLYPDGNMCFLSCWVTSDFNGKEGKKHFYDTTIISVTNSKYENTIIATPAFADRLYALSYMMYWMSNMDNGKEFFHSEECKDFKRNYDIWKVYYEHPERSLHESDSIAKVLYVNYFKANKAKMAAYYEKVNVYYRDYYDNWTDTNYIFDFRKMSLEEQFMQPLNDPAFRSAKKLKRINNHGVDLNAPDVFEQLRAKNVDSKELNDIMTYHFRRESIIKKLKGIKEAMQEQEHLNEMYQTTVFAVSKMGWINCDRFFDDPTAGKAYITVADKSANKLNFVDYSLVIPLLNVRLSGHPDSTGKWAFTNKEGVYTKLPIGMNAVVTGVSLQHDSVFFASRPIKISDGLSIDLSMKHIRKKDLKDSLETALKK